MGIFIKLLPCLPFVKRNGVHNSSTVASMPFLLLRYTDVFGRRANETSIQHSQFHFISIICNGQMSLYESGETTPPRIMYKIISFL